MSIMDLDALLSIGDRLDSQVMAEERILRITGESSPYLFSLDLVSLILRFSAPNFAHRQTRRLIK